MVTKKQRKQSRAKKQLKKVFIYMRYSSDMQTVMSIKAQRRAIMKFCEGKYEVVAEYVDEAKSATTDARPAFQKMMKDCKNNKYIGGIVVHKLDRFSRNKYNAYVYKAFLEKQNIKIISVIEHLDGSPEGDLMEGILFSMNEFYSKNLGREVQKGKKEAAHQCLHVGGIPPYGYDIGENRKYVINQSESKAVKTIFDMYINDYSYQQIADSLNKHGYTTKKGAKFNKNSFSSILENAERYTGTYIYNKAISKYSNGQRNSHKYKPDEEIIKIKGGMPRIIDDETYNKTLEKRELNKINAGKFHSKRYYLLNGLITCGECKRAYTGNTSFAGRNKSEYVTYKCGDYRGDCTNKAVNAEYINDYVLNLITDLIFTPDNYKHIIKALNNKILKTDKNNTNKIISVKNKLIQNENATNKLTDILIKSNNSQAILKKIAELEENKNILESNLNNLENNIAKMVNDADIDKVKKKFKAYLRKKDNLICRKFIRSFVDSIIIYNDKVEVILKTAN